MWANYLIAFFCGVWLMVFLRLAGNHGDGYKMTCREYEGHDYCEVRHKEDEKFEFNFIRRVKNAKRISSRK
jgi:hypothetical protein